MTGARLEVNVHVVTGAISAQQNIIACVNRAGVNVSGMVIEQLAASESVLTQDEKDLGVALVDIGGGTADIAIFERGSLWHTGVVPVGGDHFTSDIAVGLRTPMPDAEKVKRKHGCALSSMVDEEETIEVASVGGRRPRLMARRILSEILQPRAEEMFHLVWDEISKAGYEKSLNSGIVLTGGGAHSRRDARDRRADFRSADPPRGAVGRRRSVGSRRHADIRDGCRRGVVRAPQPAGRAFARVACCGGSFRDCSRDSSAHRERGLTANEADVSV